MTYWNGTNWVPEPTPPRARETRRGAPTAATARALVLAAAAVALSASAAFAAKDSPTLVVGDGTFGGTTTAIIEGTSAARSSESSTVWVRVVCTLHTDGSVGMVAWEPTDASGAATFVLGPTPSWSSGSAECRADAGTFDRHGRYRLAASTGFSVFG